MEVLGTIQTGKAAAGSSRGWFVGHFIDPSLGHRHSEDVEIKWGVHAAGEERSEWVTGETRTAIAILVSGSVELSFRNEQGEQAVTLANQGDYVMWGKGDDHKWRVIADAVVLTVRWPSGPIKS